MLANSMTNPYEPPRSPDKEPPAAKDVPTVGFLIGGLVQLGLGAAFLLGNALRPNGPSIIGLLLIFWGVGTVIKYRARRRR
jgi:hypothetical protein